MKCKLHKNFFYGTNLSGMEWHEKYGGFEVINGWRSTIYGRVFRNISSCRGIVETTKRLSRKTIKKYELIVLPKKKYDSLIHAIKGDNGYMGSFQNMFKPFGDPRYTPPGESIDTLEWKSVEHNSPICDFDKIDELIQKLKTTRFLVENGKDDQEDL